MMRLQILRNIVQEDNLNPPDGQEGELIWWKRVKSDGTVETQREQQGFEVILDLRSRLMQVRVKETRDIGAVEVAEALVSKMCEFVAVPRSRLFVQRAVTNGASVEWIVSDAVQVSGLLHRVKEAKEFEAPARPPYPAPLVPILEHLIDAVIENVRMMYQWEQDNKKHEPPHYIRVGTHVWETLKTQFLELTDNPRMRGDFAQFFDYVMVFRSATDVLKSSPLRPGGSGDYVTRTDQAIFSAAEASAGFVLQDATQLGARLVEAYGTDNQKKADRGPKWRR